MKYFLLFTILFASCKHHYVDIIEVEYYDGKLDTFRFEYNEVARDVYYLENGTVYKWTTSFSDPGICSYVRKMKTKNYEIQN